MLLMLPATLCLAALVIHSLFFRYLFYWDCDCSCGSILYANTRSSRLLAQPFSFVLGLSPIAIRDFRTFADMIEVWKLPLMTHALNWTTEHSL